MIYLICYDIADRKRLYRVAKFLEQQGLRVQKSFFQCDVDEKRLAHIRREIRKIIDEKKDGFFIYPMCDKCAQNPLTDGTGELLKLEPFEIL